MRLLPQGISGWPRWRVYQFVVLISVDSRINGQVAALVFTRHRQPVAFAVNRRAGRHPDGTRRFCQQFVELLRVKQLARQARAPGLS